MLPGSQAENFSFEDFIKVAKGAALAAFGAIAASVSQAASAGEINWRTTGWLAVAAFFSVAANGVRKLVTDTTW